ncbi:hypothetical protein [Sandaracinus amylolyticus]|uniref:hypothetical protein n=1 Tax=Sandaracinus amylolyticus TaxID=927083 RepID=UPI001F339A88|nr:hypothetical protein [Sandaracinus amylolyticus]UJR78371.1 Outer membrane autotransporter barrel [Sandaracinus amylolyticus]
MLRPFSIALAVALVLGAASDADAQRRRAGRRGARGATTQPAESTEPATEETAPAEAPAAEPTTTTPPPATTTPTAPTAPAAQVAPPPPSPTASATPPAAAADPGPMPPDLSPLRQEYVQLMDEMVQARSRVAIVGQELFQTRMTITVQDRTGGEQTLTRFVLELDGTPVHRTDGELEGGDQGRQLFEGALAPGPHVLTIDMEQRSREDTEYRTTQRESFRFIVVRDRLTEITIVLEDDSDIAREFRSGGEGRFEIRTRVRVATRALPRS